MSVESPKMPALLVVERLVLARCVRSTADRMIFRELLRADDFFCPVRSWIYSAIRSLPDCDPVIAQEICDRAVSEVAADRAVEELRSCLETANVLDSESTATTRFYASELRDVAIARRLIELGLRASKIATTGVTDWADWIAKFHGYVETQANKRLLTGSAEPEGIAAIAASLVRSIEEPTASQEALSVGASGIKTVDQRIGYFERGNFYVVAGAPGSGKSSFALQIARDVAITKRVLVFSYEMNVRQQMIRLVSGVSGVDGRAFKRGPSASETQNVKNVAHALSSLRMTFPNMQSRAYEDLVARVREEAVTEPVDCILVDYLQLLHTKRKTQSRDQEIAVISRSLKALAMEINCAVIAVVAINREAAKQGRAPQMSDLRECGAVEYDANTILALHRPNAPQQGKGRGFGGGYGQQQSQAAEHRPDGKITIELHILKQRDGETGVLPLLYIGKNTIFTDHDQSAPSARAWGN